MPRYLFLTLLCLAPLTHAATTPSSDAAHDLAYSMGASLGERLRQEVPELQLQALIEGLAFNVQDHHWLVYCALSGHTHADLPELDLLTGVSRLELYAEAA